MALGPRRCGADATTQAMQLHIHISACTRWPEQNIWARARKPAQSKKTLPRSCSSSAPSSYLISPLLPVVSSSRDIVASLSHLVVSSYQSPLLPLLLLRLTPLPPSSSPSFPSPRLFAPLSTIAGLVQMQHGCTLPRPCRCSQNPLGGNAGAFRTLGEAQLMECAPGRPRARSPSLWCCSLPRGGHVYQARQAKQMNNK